MYCQTICRFKRNLILLRAKFKTVISPYYGFVLFGLTLCPYTAAKNFQFAAKIGSYLYFNYDSVLPACADNKAFPRAKTFKASVLPFFGKRGHEVDISFVALQEHFGNSRSAAEVSVYLERRVRGPEVGKRTSFQKRTQNIIRPFAVFGPRPSVKFVRYGPTG